MGLYSLSKIKPSSFLLPVSTNVDYNLQSNVIPRRPLPSSIICYHCGSQETCKAGRKKYSREELIKLLRRIAAPRNRQVLPADIDMWFYSGRGPSSRAFEREFGGIARARLAAGILNVYRKEGGATKNWQKYAPEELVNQLQELGKILGRKPTDRDINRASKEGICASAVTFVRVFGSLVQAYKKTGFERVKPHTYTDREILSALKKLAREKGAMPNLSRTGRRQ